MPYLLQQQAQQPATDVNVNASDLAAQIRAQVNQQQQAGVSAQAAKAAADRAAQGASDVTVITKNGKTVTIRTPHVGPVAPQAPVAISEDQEPVIATSSGTSLPANFPRDVPQRVENLGYAFFLMIAIIAVGKPLVRVFGNIIEHRAIKPAMPQEFGARLERIEQGIESVSIEVERISESQRYLLKVQSPTPERVELPRSAS